jgi:hypothetical protein
MVLLHCPFCEGFVCDTTHATPSIQIYSKGVSYDHHCQWHLPIVVIHHYEQYTTANYFLCHEELGTIGIVGRTALEEFERRFKAVAHNYGLSSPI